MPPSLSLFRPLTTSDHTTSPASHRLGYSSTDTGMSGVWSEGLTWKTQASWITPWIKPSLLCLHLPLSQRMARVPLGSSSSPSISLSVPLLLDSSLLLLQMSSKRPSNDYVHAFHASVRKVASGPTFLHFASSTPPDQVVSAVPTLLREFGDKEPRYTSPATLHPRQSITEVHFQPEESQARA